MLRVQWKPEKDTKEVSDGQAFWGEIVGFVGDGGYVVAVVRCGDHKIRSVHIEKLDVI